jgi:hypothetical protein
MLGSAAGNLIDKDIINLIATTFHELREGQSAEGTKIDQPAAVMSTAEAVSVYYQTALTGLYYDNGAITVDNLVQNLMGAVVKENRDDVQKLKAYFNSVVKTRSKDKGGRWDEFYEARKWVK